MNQLSIKRMSEISKKKRKGFTLVELIIVIAIIAILAAIAIPKFGTVRENSNKSSDVANAKIIYTAAAKAIANGDITYAAAINNAALSSVGGYNLAGDLDGITATTALRTAAHRTETFVVSVDTNGDITISGSGAAHSQIYPNTDATFNAN